MNTVSVAVYALSTATLESSSSTSSYSSTATTVSVCGFLHSLSPLQAQKMEHEMCAVEQLQRAVAQGCEDEQPHLIIFNTYSGTGNTLAGRATGSSLLV